MFLICKSICLHACMCTTCIPGACGGHKMALDSLDLELLQVIVSNLVDTGN